MQKVKKGLMKSTEIFKNVIVDFNTFLFVLKIVYSYLYDIDF